MKAAVGEGEADLDDNALVVNIVLRHCLSVTFNEKGLFW